MKLIKTVTAFLTLIVLSLGSPARAEEKYQVVDPATLRMSNFRGDGIAFYNAGTSCWGGQVLGSELSPADKNRLTAVYLTALTAKKKMYFQYAPEKNCQITVFGIDKQ